MKKFLVLLMVLTMAFTGYAEEIPPAEIVLEHFMGGEYEAICEMMSDEVRAAVSAEALKSAWEGQLAQLGQLQSAQFAEQQGYSVALLTHEKGSQQLIVGLNSDGRVETLLLQPVNEAQPTSERALPEGAQAQAVKLFAGTEKELNAQIIAPEGCKAWAVLIHGSGPSDMDETVGACKPFRDLAYDLAAQGVGTIRFDKMSFVHPELTATLADEYLDPVAEALRVLKQETGAEKAIAVGHSQGGMLMPWLVSECGFDGGVALAGTPKQLWEISYQQNLAIMEQMSGEQLAAAQAQVNAELEKARKLATLEDTEMVFGLPASYLKEMAALDQIELARSANVPMLFMWGNADFQVSRADFEAWEAGLSGGEAFAFMEYNGLNHLFMQAQEGDSIANASAVYARGGEMDLCVAADIAGWLKECGLWAE